jgi:hypothetical protein
MQTFARDDRRRQSTRSERLGWMRVTCAIVVETRDIPVTGRRHPKEKKKLLDDNGR